MLHTCTPAVSHTHTHPHTHFQGELCQGVCPSTCPAVYYSCAAFLDCGAVCIFIMQCRTWFLHTQTPGLDFFFFFFFIHATMWFWMDRRTGVLPKQEGWDKWYSVSPRAGWQRSAPLRCAEVDNRMFLPRCWFRDTFVIHSEPVFPHPCRVIYLETWAPVCAHACMRVCARVSTLLCI